MIVFVIFLISWMGLISAMPSDLYESGYTSPGVIIPDEFEAWDYYPQDIWIEKQLIKGGKVKYDFETDYNLSQKYRIDWNTFISNEIQVRYARGLFLDFGVTYQTLLPFIDKTYLIAHFDYESNYTLMKYGPGPVNIICYFEDFNSTRNDIGLAYDAGELNCTISIPTSQEDKSVIGAREIILALLTFRIPSVYKEVHPLLGFLMSLMVYVPVAFMFFAIGIKILHGGD